MTPISIIICSRDRPQQLQQCLSALATQVDDACDVLVVASAPTTGAEKAIAVQFAARYIHQPRPGLDVARNTGLRHAHADIIAFIDDDATPQPGWLAAIRAAFADETVDCVTGRILPGILRTPAQGYFEIRFSFDRGPNPIRFDAAQEQGWFPIHPYHLGAGCNMAFRRRLFRQVGLFDEALDAGTLTGGGGDLDIFRRLLMAGLTAVYAPQAQVIHQHRAETKQSRRQFYAYGKAFTALMTKVWFENHVNRRAVLRIIWQQLIYLARLVGRRIRRTRHNIPLLWIFMEAWGNLRGPEAYLRARWRAKREMQQSWPPVHIIELDVNNKQEQTIPPGEDLWLLFRQHKLPRSSKLILAPGPILSSASIQHLAEALPSGEKMAIQEEYKPSVALIICTRDRPQALTSCLKSLEPLRPFIAQLILVDNSDDPSHTISAGEKLAATVQHQPQPGLCRARNHGLAAATTDIVAFVDDDVIFDPCWWSGMLVAYQQNPDAAGVSGLVIPGELETADQRQFEFLLGGLSRGFVTKKYTGRQSRMNAPQLGVGANMSFRREAILQIGGFDPLLDSGTPTRAGGDIDAFYRLLAAGGTLIYTPHMLVRHMHRRYAGAAREMSAAYGCGTTATYTKWVLQGDLTAARMLLGLLLRHYPTQLWQSLTREHGPLPGHLWSGWKDSWRGPWIYLKSKYLSS